MEKKEKKVRVKKINGAKKVPLKERLGSLFFTVLALILALAVFVGFMILQSVFSENIIYKEVLVVVKDIPESEILTEENIAEYFGTKKVNELYTVKEAMSPEQMQQLVGMKSRIPLYVGEEVTATDFTNVNVYLDYIENPVEMSIATSGISGTDGGKIRAGDVVNITMMFSKEQLGIAASGTPSSYNPTSGYYAEDGKPGSLSSVGGDTSGYNFGFYAKYMLENIYIKEVLASDGHVIPPTDKETTASIIIIVVPKRIELQLNNIISNCSSMRISKVLYEISPEDLFNDSSLTNGIANLEELPDDDDSTQLESEGWTEPDENGLRYKTLLGNMHSVLASDGKTEEEPCDFGDGTYCIHCKALKAEDTAPSDEE